MKMEKKKNIHSKDEAGPAAPMHINSWLWSRIKRSIRMDSDDEDDVDAATQCFCFASGENKEKGLFFLL